MESERTGRGETKTLQKVFVVSDERDSRESLVAMLSAFQFAVVPYESPEAFFSSYKKTWAGCVLMELAAGADPVIGLLEEMQQREIKLPVVVIAHAMEISGVVRAMQLGALHLTETPYDGGELRHWLQQGLSLDAKRRNKEEFQGAAREQLKLLTEDEHRVLGGILSGGHNKVIAARLDIGVRTVQARRAAIMRKLNCQSVAELVWKVVVARSNESDELPSGGERIGFDRKLVGASEQINLKAMEV